MLRVLAVVFCLVAGPLALPQDVNLDPVTMQHVMVPMRDGERLSTYIYLPPGQGPWPVLYEQRYADLIALRA